MYELSRTIVKSDGRNEEKILQVFGRQVGFTDMDRIPKKMKKMVEETKELSYDNYSVTQLYQSEPIASVTEDTVTTVSGNVFKSKILARVMENADTLVLIAAALDGFEKMMEEHPGITEQLYLDGWATAILTSANLDLRMDLKKQIEDAGYFTTSTWSPGQHGFEIHNQRPTFAILQPEEIGMALKDSLMMSPQKTETLIFGISSQKQEDSPIPCTYCPSRATCPSAFAEEVYENGMC